MNRGQIREKAKFYMNFNASQVNDDISDANWNTLVNDAYRQVWTRVRSQISRAGLLTSVDVPWPAGQQTYTLPAYLQDAAIYDLWQLDGNSNPVAPVGCFFETRNVLRLPLYPLGNQGFTMRIYFIPEVDQLANDSDSPTLIPPVHHDVIVWECLKIAKIIADKEIPESWTERLEDIEFSLVKELGTRPIANRSNIIYAQGPRSRPLAYF